jgi:chemotaxis protein CheD
MSNPIVVGISDMNIASKTGILVTYALGSCVGICLYDRVMKISGLSHILLPEAAICPSDNNVMKFADTAVQTLIERMERSGANRARLTAKIAGGARLFGNGIGIQIGDRNVAAVKEQLARFRIPLIAEDTGLNYGRTVEFHSDEGTVYIKTALKGVKSI